MGINAINILSSTDVTFRKAFHLKERSLTLFPFGNVVNLVYFLVLFANKMTSSANRTNRPFSYSTKESGSRDIFIHFYAQSSIEWR